MDKIAITARQVRENQCPRCEVPSPELCLDERGQVRRKNGMPSNHIERVHLRRSQAI